MATVPKTGGAIRVLATGHESPYGIAVDSLGVYWTNASAGTVMMLPRAATP